MIRTPKNTQKKIIQKDLLQLITNISATSLKLINKKTKSVKAEVILFIPNQDLHSSDIFLYCNKNLSDTSDTEFYPLLTNMYKPPKNFDFLEIEQSFRFVRFEEFPSVCYSQ